LRKRDGQKENRVFTGLILRRARNAM